MKTGSVPSAGTTHGIPLISAIVTGKTIDRPNQFRRDDLPRPCCGETVPDYLIEGYPRAADGSMRYYVEI